MDKAISVPADFEPRDYQLKLFQSMDGVDGKPETKKKRAFARWHRRAGKDLACLCYMFKEMFVRKGIYYYFLPTYQQGKKIIWEGIDKEGYKFLDRMPKELIENINNQEMMFRTVNGSVFRVIGTDNIDNIVGTNPIGCVFSEFSLQDPQAWDFIRPILSENDGWAIFNGTPRGKNHMYALDMKIRDNKDWCYSELQSLWPEKPNYSGVVSEKKIQAERDSGMDEATIEQEFGVSYAAGVQGAYYADQIEDAYRTNRIGNYPADSYRYVDTFWDVGFSDDTAIWFRQVEGGRIVWVDYYENNNKDIAHYVKVLREKGYNYRTHYLPWDGKSSGKLLTGMSLEDMLSQLCREAQISDDVTCVTRTKVQDGIQAVRRRFSKFYFNEPNCQEGIQKISLYHKRFDSKRQVFLKDPVHDYTSHAADALRTEATQEELMEDEFWEHNNIVVLKDYDPFN